MEEKWYTITGGIDSNVAHQLIVWVNSQIYATPIKRLKLILSSNGGDMDSAIRIYSFLKSLPIEVETIAFSQIDSAANILFAGGEKRTAVKGCRFFFHEGSFTIGNPTNTLHNHKENISIFEELFKNHVKILAKESGQTEKYIRGLLEKGTFLNTEEAKTAGFVHAIVEKIPLTKQIPQ